MTNHSLVTMALSNSAPATPYKTYDIIPTDGGGPILLHGRLLSYAEFTVPYTVSTNTSMTCEQLRYVRQELYVSSDGQYLAVETITLGDASGYQRECACWSYTSANEVKPPFRYPKYRGALLLQAGIDCPWTIEATATSPSYADKTFDTLKLWFHTVFHALKGLGRTGNQADIERAIIEADNLYQDYCNHHQALNSTFESRLLEQRLAAIAQHSVAERRQWLLENQSWVLFIMSQLPNMVILPASSSGFTHVIFQGQLLSQHSVNDCTYQLYQLINDKEEHSGWVGRQQQDSHAHSSVEHLELPQDIYQFFGADIAFTLVQQIDAPQRPLLCIGSKENNHG
ncbi:hypothetical protein GCM10007938_33470 [Vibrio zhanjiangensis]|uniref:Uncharacterized protein n=1 Tax=Vibrio zhanjiangensis TaxID=1046128 RepID=A0ABQ6F478_9VIBR|nr:hypothetical protein [Vibrio zhanjiangensis]GLT19565.1 hypothetical protein GCM10007938_33470 [Vibrio zhanjiangensis]